MAENNLRREKCRGLLKIMRKRSLSAPPPFFLENPVEVDTFNYGTSANGGTRTDSGLKFSEAENGISSAFKVASVGVTQATGNSDGQFLDLANKVDSTIVIESSNISVGSVINGDALNPSALGGGIWVQHQHFKAASMITVDEGVGRGGGATFPYQSCDDTRENLKIQNMTQSNTLMFIPNIKLERELRSLRAECPICFELLKKKAVEISQIIARIIYHPKDPSFCSCQRCKLIFPTHEILNDHYKREHKDERPYKCIKCGKGFKRQDLLRNHISIYERRRRWLMAGIEDDDYAEWFGGPFMNNNDSN